MIDPIVIDGLLHVGGRLRKESLTMESKQQIVLPKEDHVTRLIIDNYNKACWHSGREHVLASVRQKFWITQGSSTVRRVLEKCVSCRRGQAQLCQQKMADLLESRVLAGSHLLHQWAWIILTHSKSVVGRASQRDTV